MSRVSDGGTCAPEIVWYGEVVNMRATVSDPETRRSRKDGSCDGKKKMDQEIQQQYALPPAEARKEILVSEGRGPLWHCWEKHDFYSRFLFYNDHFIF